MSGVWRYVALAAAAMVLSACSATDFKAPIDGFSKATKAAAASFTEYQKVVDAVSEERKISAGAINTFRNVRERSGDCRDTSHHCRLEVNMAGHWRPLSAEPTAPNIQKIMNGLVSYSMTLEAIAGANTAGEVKTAVDAANGSITNLANAANALNTQLGHRNVITPQLTAFTTPASEVIAFGLGKYLEHVKLKALKDATSGMDSIFPEIVPLFGAVGSSAVGLKLSELEDAYVSAKYASRSAPNSRPKLAAWEKAAEAYNAALSIKPTKVFDDLQKTHAALSASLKSPNISFELVWKYLQNVADDAATLSAAAKAFDAAEKVKS